MRNLYEQPPKRSIYTNTAILIMRGAAVFLFLYLAFLFYETALLEIIGRAGTAVGFVVLWVVTAYIVLPRVHRFMTGLYLPNYFIGRAKTPDGLLADPVNLAIIGSEQRLVQMMEQAGWVRADPITPRSVLRIIWASLLRRSYPSAPVSNLMLFDKPQQLAFQKELDGNIHTRHHVRFWPTPENWLLPGGYPADWLGAATFDRSVGLSLFTGQITHKIDEDTDRERDFVMDDLTSTGARYEYIKNFNTAYHHRGGGGDSIKTDGAMPFVVLPD